MYEHELQLGQNVIVQTGYGEEIEGVIVKLWNDSAYITVETDTGERYAGPEYNAEIMD